MTSKVLEQSDVRFSISNDGWKRLNAGRKAPDLIREAVSNTFDADDITEVSIMLRPGFVSIEDNSPTGISDPALVTTVFLTNKEDSIFKRGRKGRGLKELISAADEAEVDTVGYKTIFGTGRTVVESDRKVGTKVSVNVPSWGQGEIEAAIKYLGRIIPPKGVVLKVNDVQVKPRKLRSTIKSVPLNTQIVMDGIQREIRRDANVEIYNLAKGERIGWIYEMGIPITEISTRFHVNICQRVPLNDNRDTVESGYLSMLYSHILNEMAFKMSARALSKHAWVDVGMHSLYHSTENCIIRKLTGTDKNVIKSWEAAGSIVPSQGARYNDICRQHGYNLIDLNGLSYNLATIMRTNLPTAEDVVSKIDSDEPEVPIDAAIAEPTGRLQQLVSFLGMKLIHKQVNVKFFSKSSEFTDRLTIAHWHSNPPTIGFNIKSSLPLSRPCDQNILATIVHELAHSTTSLHDQYFSDTVQSLAGKLAVVMLEEHAAIQEIISPSKISRKSVLIQCSVCNAGRFVYPQDVWQVTKCISCTKEARKIRARQNRISKRI